MGCTNSRMNSVETVPEKIRPFLARRYEEIKKRRPRSSATMQKETTLSNKKLLKEDEDIGSNSSNNAAEAEFLKPPEVKVEAIINNVAPLPELSDTQQHEAATEDAENNDDNTKETLQEEKEKEKDDTQKIEETVSKNEDEHVDDTDDDDSDDYDLGGRIICPGSPSFKIYCNAHKNDKEETKSQEMDTDQKSASVESLEEPVASGHVKAPSADSVNSASSSHNSKSLNEVAETQTASKRKNRKMTFKSVKNIMAVKSLYTGCSRAGNDRTHIVAAKTTKSQ